MMKDEDDKLNPTGAAANNRRLPTNMTTTFIYNPKSGDRVFAEKNDGQIHVVRWANGSRHVVNGVHLSWNAATPGPGHYWRGPARRMLGILVNQYGGIAWDEQGTIQAVVPVNLGKLVVDWMSNAAQVLGVKDSDLHQNWTRLLLAGWSTGYPGYDGSVGMEPLFFSGNPTSPTLHGKATLRRVECPRGGYRPEEENTGGYGLAKCQAKYQLIVTDAGGIETVAAEVPASWGKPVSHTFVNYTVEKEAPVEEEEATF